MPAVLAGLARAHPGERPGLAVRAEPDHVAAQRVVPLPVGAGRHRHQLADHRLGRVAPARDDGGDVFDREPSSHPVNLLRVIRHRARLSPRRPPTGTPPASARRRRPRRSARPPVAGRPGRSRAARSGSASSSLIGAARSATNRSGSSGVPVPSVGLLDRHQQAGLAVGDHLGDAAGGGRHHRRLAGHRLQVDDAHRLVDRRADEDGGVGEHLDHLGLGQHLRPPRPPRSGWPAARRPAPPPRRRSPGCPARRRAAPAGRRPAASRAARSR